MVGAASMLVFSLLWHHVGTNLVVYVKPSACVLVGGGLHAEDAGFDARSARTAGAQAAVTAIYFTRTGILRPLGPTTPCSPSRA